MLTPAQEAALAIYQQITLDPLPLLMEIRGSRKARWIKAKMVPHMDLLPLA
jgi:hypothetical protein